MRKEPISGIFVPNIAPYTKDGRLNEPELRKIVRWLINKGVTGLYPNGSMGEFIRLSFEERLRLVEIVADEANGEVPILAGAAEANIDMVLETCEFCAKIGCRAVSITGPYYFKVSQESIEHYFREISRQSPIDIIMYNIPAFANEISLPVIERLAMDCENIIGTKDSSADMSRVMHLIHDIKSKRPDFSVLIGWEEIFIPAMIMGADGGTLSTAGVIPEVFVKMWKEFSSGNIEACKQLQFKILTLFKTMLEATNFPEGFREGYSVRGFDVGRARQPMSPNEESQMAGIRNQIACILADCGYQDAAAICQANKMTQSSVSGIDTEEIVRAVMAKIGKR